MGNHGIRYDANHTQWSERDGTGTQVSTSRDAPATLLAAEVAGVLRVAGADVLRMLRVSTERAAAAGKCFPGRDH